MRGNGPLTILALLITIFIAHGPIAGFAQSASPQPGGALQRSDSLSALQAQQQVDAQRRAEEQRQADLQKYIQQRAEEQRQDQIREQREQEARDRETVLLQQQRAQADAERESNAREESDEQSVRPRAPQRNETPETTAPAAAPQQVNLNPNGSPSSVRRLEASIGIGLLAGALAVFLGKIIQRRFRFR